MPILDEFNLSNKVAIIAGDGAGSTPILAETLVEAGAKVFLIAESRTILNQSLEGLVRQDDVAFGVVANPIHQIELENALTTLFSRWNKVDILVNNFQSAHCKPFQDTTVMEWEETMAQTLRPVVFLCNNVGRRMIHQQHGRIVNIISGLAERGLFNSSVSCATQGAILQLTRALSLECATHDLRVNAIGTGWYTVEEDPRQEVRLDRLLRYIPNQRLGHPKDIAPLIVYLCSDACGYTTGQPIYVDGGLMAHP